MNFLVVCNHKAAVAAPWSCVQSTVLTMCRWRRSWKSAVAFTAQLAAREREPEEEVARVLVVKAVLHY